VRVTAIERDARASAYTGARLPHGSSALGGPVEDHLAGALPADVIVLNPPRGGVESAVTDALSAARHQGAPPRLIVYVSCDPATLARDVARLVGWRVADTRCFDMFPQTSHVETVCLLRPEA
jgi:23S rRNA (uracil1939-C5)-methyltransferase